MFLPPPRRRNNVQQRVLFLHREKEARWLRRCYGGRGRQRDKHENRVETQFNTCIELFCALGPHALHNSLGALAGLESRHTRFPERRCLIIRSHAMITMMAEENQTGVSFLIVSSPSE